MGKIDFERFLLSFIEAMKESSQMKTFSIPLCIKKALEAQGLEYKDGEIVKTQRRVSSEAKETGYGESEDEKVRKALISVFSNREKYLIDQSFGDITVSEILAWLVKQADHAKFRNSIQVGDKVTRNQNGMLVNISQLNRVAKKDEKQGEQNHSEQDLEMVVKPKFNIGYWIVSDKPYINDDYRLCNIIGIEDGCYTIQSANGYEGYNFFEIWESDYHLWSIEDARDGDVLVCNNNPFLFTKYDKDEYGLVCCSYCGISGNGEFIVNSNAKKYWCDIEFVYPATKEQHDTLFAKMREAGYMWNAEKKELKLLITNGGDFDTKNCEQKSANKIEPKFKVGDWVVYKNDICQIVKREEGCNKLVTAFGIEKELVNERNLSTARLWTIQDAKDGDILDANGAPFIYKRHDEDYVYFYCGVNLADEFIEANGIDTWNSSNKVYPATKVQRDLLLQKMHEAGYEWDVEKKELSKIGQKSTEKVEPKFKVGDKIRRKTPRPYDRDMQVARVESDYYLCNHLGKFSSESISFLEESNYELVEQEPIEWKQENREELSDFENAMMHIGGSFFGENAGLDPNDTATIKEQAELLLELAPKTEWSEEDERLLSKLQTYVDIECFDRECNGDDLLVWLKSLKDRTQPKVELTQLDKNILEAAIAFVEQNNHFNYWGGVDKHTVLSALYSLRPQNTWKPSDEQMKALDSAIDEFDGYREFDSLVSLKKDLKKLKEE